MTGGINIAWPKDREQTLREMWANGFSAGEIGRTLGVTKNSAIGKVHRLGIATDRPTRFALPNPTHATPAAAARWSKPRPKTLTSQVNKSPPKRSPPRAPTLPPERNDVPVEMRKRLLDLKSQECRWPIGTPGAMGFGFCGAAVPRDATGLFRKYCNHHRAIARKAPA